MSSTPARRPKALLCGALLLAAGPVTALAAAASGELEPADLLKPISSDAVVVGRYADRTLVLGIQVDRDEASVISYTLKEQPLLRAVELPVPRGYREGRRNQVEVVLLGPGGRFTQRLDVGPYCFSHGAHAEPHIAGDTILMHRDTFLARLPELPGFDHVEIAYYDESRAGQTRRVIGSATLDQSRFSPAGRPLTYEQLAIARTAGNEGPASSTRTSTASWPEDFGDPDLYTIFGDPAGGAERVNIVMVPDGYTYAQKALMQQHAAGMVNYFRGIRPFTEHDEFINYTLVYAYSSESGTDECDCGVIRDTIMGTRFPATGAPCGDSANRCLFYGAACDTSGTENIVEAELRAPYQDVTILMVNTPRYGGCGGGRAAYSAANSAATDVALHEAGHSLAGLADEYGGEGCGTSASEINTSMDPIRGAWKEWAPFIGLPTEGGQYFDSCVYRPLPNCEMRNLYQPFCPVCNQRWALIFFGHPRVAPTAPVAGVEPASPVTAYLGQTRPFRTLTRLASGAVVTNELTWTVDGPGFPEPAVVATGSASYIHTFDQLGQHTISCEVIADTNFVLPPKYGANVDTASWTVEVQPVPDPPLISGPATAEPLRFLDRESLVWEDGLSGGAFTYNLYLGDLAELAAGDYGYCSQPGLASNSATTTEDPPPGSGWFYLVTAVNPLGEGSMGTTSSGQPRTNTHACP